MTDVPYIPQPQTVTINVQDAIAHMQWQYATAILLTGIFLLIYVLWNNFVRAPEPKVNEKYIKERLNIEPILATRKIEKLGQEFDLLAIMPTVFLVVIGFSYFTGWKGW